ncbi:uncharacterized protein UTRI_03254 [Ustilago trichophora]|uniref:F-box domain-containing protein n=1 Tax=Ustilago trichophora TaxID=86804 RepID=A0A5C3E9K6_9BASI|nr:uncharacterized protein UTRI_03254 [Ustilago trichophora]
MAHHADPSKRLPPETFSHILSFLNPPSLLQTAQVSRVWSEFCLDESLWRELSIRLGYCQLERAAEERRTCIRVVGSVLQQIGEGQQGSSQDLLQATIERYRTRNTTTLFDGCASWRHLCCRLWRLNCNWLPSQPTNAAKPELAEITDVPSSIQTTNAPSSSLDDFDIDAAGSDLPEIALSSYLFPHRRLLHIMPQESGVWRCKIDPEERTYIVSGQNGGIQVFDHSTKTLLWHIPRTATRPCPHLEFSRGWFIFDRPGIGHFEVWRSERLVPDLGREPDRGHYQRFAILSSIRPTRAYRFQYPYLCAASQDGFIMIWDVPQQQLVETIDMRGSPHKDGNITYIDFDDEFVFVTGMGAKSVSVFSRSTQQLVWNMGQHFASRARPPTTWRLEDSQSNPWPGFVNPAFVQRRLTPASPGPWQAGPNTLNLAQMIMTPYQIWSAVHPDIKTKTLVILGQGTVLLLKDYKKFFSDPSQAPDLFIEIEFENLQEYYSRTFRFARTDVEADLEWNSRRLWEHRGDAQLTVHEGRAVIVNEFLLILDLNVEAAALHDGGSDAATIPAASNAEREEQTSTNQNRSEELRLASSTISTGEPLEQAEDGDRTDPERDHSSAHQEVPPVLLYSEVHGLVHYQYRECSSVQMDEAGIYLSTERNLNQYPLFEETDGLVLEQPVDSERVLLHLDFTKRMRAGPLIEEQDLSYDSDV